MHSFTSRLMLPRNLCLIAALFGPIFLLPAADAQVTRNGLGYREWIRAAPNASPLPANAENLAVAKNTIRASNVIGLDQRERVLDTTAYPYRTMGLVISEIQTAGESIYYAGTGTLLGTKTVLTCAHNLVNDDGGWADAVSFTPGKDCDYEPYGQFNAVRLVAPEAFWQNDENYDIAMMVLDQPAGETVGHMQIEVLPTSYFEDSKLNTAGYASDLGGCSSQYLAYGYAYGMLLGLVRHDMDSATGQSGSPDWIYDLDSLEPSIVAVHILGGTDYNIAVRISDELFDWINDYLKENDTVWYDDPTEPAATDTTPAPAQRTCGFGAAPPLALAALGLISLRLIGRRRSPSNIN